MYTAVLILNYNNAKDTINCIRSVEQYNTAEIRYIIVENGSNAETIHDVSDFLKQTFDKDYKQLSQAEAQTLTAISLPRVTYLVTPTNDGYAQGNNKGLDLIHKDADADYILILNNDILFIQDIIPTLLNYHRRLPDCGIISPLLLAKNRKDIDYTCARLNVRPKEIILRYLFLYHNPFHIISRLSRQRFILKKHPEKLKQETFEVQLPSGSCMLIKRKDMQTIGNFDSGTFLYYEENILFKREQRLGLKNYIVPSLRCVHLGSSSINRSPSAFTTKAEHNSANYYLLHYENLTTFQRMLWKVDNVLFRLKNIIRPLFRK